MNTELNPPEREEKQYQIQLSNRTSDTVYAIGLIGAWVYFIGRAGAPGEKVRAFFKAFVWPAILVYKLFEFLDKA